MTPESLWQPPDPSPVPDPPRPDPLAGLAQQLAGAFQQSLAGSGISSDTGVDPALTSAIEGILSGTGEDGTSQPTNFDPRTGGLPWLDPANERTTASDSPADLGTGVPFGPNSLNQIVNDVFDALTPGGSGTQNFVDRLTDGLQQSQGLGATEARDLAQKFYDGLQPELGEGQGSADSFSGDPGFALPNLLGDGINQNAQELPRIPTTAEEALRSDVQEFAVNFVLAAGVMAAYAYAIEAAIAAAAAGEGVLASWWQRVANLVRAGQTAAPEAPAAEESAATKALETTAHGATRIAGPAATRGGVLTQEAIQSVREAGQVMTQTDGATVRILQVEGGRFNVVIEGDRGIITTFQGLSQKSLERLGKNYGWH